MLLSCEMESMGLWEGVEKEEPKEVDRELGD